MSERPGAGQALVSIGVLVRNGGAWLDEALDQLVAQTHANLEIIISDNNSDDDTAEICQRRARGDQRIAYFRQSATLSALQNFRFVFDQAGADFFMWAAHDDRHSPNYVECLLACLQRDPGASLAFSDVAIFHDATAWRSAPRVGYEFSCEGTERFWRGLLNRDYIRAGYLHVYGLFRKAALAGYPWPDLELGGDRPMLLYLWRRGRFARAEGACFYCYKPEQKKSRDQRAREISGKRRKPFIYLRLSWACATAACAAERLEGRRRSRGLVFALLVGRELRKRSIVGAAAMAGRLRRLMFQRSAR